ncbi:hypothetical protein KFE25_010842 [Diacronema lutheri]|uniref:Uncharacterized protein n=1 Tax=Diacronema lutheri TaxID=2081491 RepID=A0A8J5XGY6_DIALT|nr:hypothetical protein KFE25_010842 [Diacronema lutheri]|mmetsp:Transcript_13355/g.41876  ORF Transcript_13355/g.41876 Transcript_13355/m.41876 type:complete len:111 (+) Transcript_13355:152-484(+)
MVNSHLFPPSWGVPPEMQTRDYRTLPGGYGHGSGTLAKWIVTKMDEDSQNGCCNFPPAWGEPPTEQKSADSEQLPLGYGTGPAPLAAWIRAKAKELGGYNDAEIDDMSSA